MALYIRTYGLSIFTVVLFLYPRMLSQNVPSSNLSLIRDSAQNIASGNLSRAESELQSVLTANPEEYRAMNLLGIIRAQQHRETEAEQLFKRAIELRPEFASTHMDLGLLYVQWGKPEGARPEFQKTLEIDPSRSDARAALVKLDRDDATNSLRQKNLEKALASLIEARKLSPQNYDVSFEFGMVALRMSLFPDAVEAFQHTLQGRPDEGKVIYGLGRAQIGLTKFQDAKESFLRYTKLHPEDASGHYALGFVLRALQQGPQARGQLEKSIQLQPTQTESYFCLGSLDLDENDLDRASKHFDQALQHDPRHAGALAGLGRVAFEKKQYESAVALLQRAVSSDPSLREAHYYLGMAYGRVGQKGSFEKELAIARQLDQEEVGKQHLVLKLLSPDEAASNGSAP